MKYKTLIGTALALTMAPAAGTEIAIGRGELAPQLGTMLDYSPLRGKGHNKRPRHSSARFVAQDKRDARKARNR